MRIGIPKEIKDNEYRVGMVPAGVHALVSAGHEVVLQESAGNGSGIPNEEYTSAGARLVPDAASVWNWADMVIKVKEPVGPEYDLMRPGQTLFTYLHLAPLPELTDVLLDKQVAGVAYETIEDRSGRLPLLTPMSEVAGRMAVAVGASYLQKVHGGRGTLLAGVPGVP
ncbi:MAG: alanine dehydrogenase, partial [Acidobacteriota bacterium]